MWNLIFVFVLCMVGDGVWGGVQICDGFLENPESLRSSEAENRWSCRGTLRLIEAMVRGSPDVEGFVPVVFFPCKFHLVIVFRRSVWSHSDAVRHTLFRAFCFQTAEILKTYCCVNHFILPSYQTVCVTATDTLFIRTKTSHKQSSLLRSSVHWLLSRHSEYISGLLLWLLPYFFSWGLYR